MAANVSLCDFANDVFCAFHPHARFSFPLRRVCRGSVMTNRYSEEAALPHRKWFQKNNGVVKGTDGKSPDIEDLWNRDPSSTRPSPSTHSFSITHFP